MEISIEDIKKKLEDEQLLVRVEKFEDVEDVLEISFPEVLIGGWPLTLQMVLQQSTPDEKLKNFLPTSLIQCTIILPDNVKEKFKNDILLLLMAINKVSIIAGFTFDPKSRQVFFRATIPILKKKTFLKMMNFMLNQILELMEIYGTIIRNVARGDLSYREILRGKHILKEKL